MTNLVVNNPINKVISIQGKAIVVNNSCIRRIVTPGRTIVVCANNTVKIVRTSTTPTVVQINNQQVKVVRIGAAGSVAPSDHGILTGLADDDHTQYHTDFRALTWLGTRSTDDLPEGANLYYTQARFDTAFVAKTTTNLTEGVNLYYTNERVDDRVNNLLQDGGGLTWTYNDISGTLTPAIDHGGIGGLTDDDHTQYTLADGTRAFTGAVGGITPSSTSDLATKGYVDSLAQGIDWQDSVLDKNLVTSPASPSTGDRYIIAGIGGDWSSGTIDDIAEYDGAAWSFETPNEGFAAWVEDEDKLYVYNGAAWVTFGSTVDHGNLSGLGDDDHTQYHNDSRALTWLGTRSTTDLSEGTNLYYTQARFDTAFAAKSTTDLSEGTNLYYTDTRARAALSGGDGITYNSTTGAIVADINTTNLKFTTSEINTIQNIATNSEPEFNRIKLGGHSEGAIMFFDSSKFSAQDSNNLFWDNTNKFLSIGNNNATTQLDVTGTITSRALTATRLMASDGSKGMASVSDLTTWIAGTTNQVTVTDDLDGSLTLSLPQNIHTSAEPTFNNIIASGLTPGAVIFIGGTNALAQDSAKLFWDNTGKLFGMGTNTPDRLLTLQTGGDWLSLKNAAGTTKWHLSPAGATGLSFSETGAADGRIFIKAGGNVGFGTTNPLGNMQLTSGSPQFLFLQSGASADNGLWDFLVTTESFNLRTINDANSAAANIMTVNRTGTIVDNIIFGGDVGIGATPVNKLDVEGAAVIGAAYSGTNTAPTNGLLVEGNISIGESSPDATASIHINSVNPKMVFVESGVTADNGRWDFLMDSESFRFRTVNDGNSAANNVMTVERTGIVIDTIQLAGKVGIDAVPSISLAIGDADTGIDWVSDGIIDIKTNGASAIHIGSDQKVGIGTITTPHAGVGLAKLAIEGTDGDAAGPHMQFTTPADDYPLLQILPWQHDNVSINFDAYFTTAGTGWTSSDAGSNFQIAKGGDKLRIQYDSGVAAGSAITWNKGITLNIAGKVGIGGVDPNLSLTIGDSDTGIDWISDGIFELKTDGQPVIRMDNAQKVGINVTSMAAQLDVDQTSASAAIPVIRLKQVDADYALMNYVGTEGSGSSIDTRTTSGATSGHLKKQKNGTDIWVAFSTTAPS